MGELVLDMDILRTALDSGPLSSRRRTASETGRTHSINASRLPNAGRFAVCNDREALPREPPKQRDAAGERTLTLIGQSLAPELGALRAFASSYGTSASSVLLEDHALALPKRDFQ